MPKKWCATQIEDKKKSEYKISPANLNRYAVLFWFSWDCVGLYCLLWGQHLV